jgi:hypothetical protein
MGELVYEQSRRNGRYHTIIIRLSDFIVVGQLGGMNTVTVMNTFTMKNKLAITCRCMLLYYCTHYATLSCYDILLYTMSADR